MKYIGETSRSGYERLREHYKDLENISPRSHMLKHYIEKHKEIKVEEMKFSVKILKSYRSAFERQIGESVYINHNLKQGTYLLNSKNEYNRCIIPRLEIDLGKDEYILEYEENEKEKEIKREIQHMKEKMRYEKETQKHKKQKLMRELTEIEKENPMKGQRQKDKVIIKKREKKENKKENNWGEKEAKLWELRIRKEKLKRKLG